MKNTLYTVLFRKHRFLSAVDATRILLGDIFSFGMVSQTLSQASEIIVECYKDNERLVTALEEIIDCETAVSNGTTKRIIKIAEMALYGETSDE